MYHYITDKNLNLIITVIHVELFTTSLHRVCDRLKVNISVPTFVKRAIHLDRLLSDTGNMHSYEDSRAHLPCSTMTLTILACECEFGQVAL